MQDLRSPLHESLLGQTALPFVSPGRRKRRPRGDSEASEQVAERDEPKAEQAEPTPADSSDGPQLALLLLLSSGHHQGVSPREPAWMHPPVPCKTAAQLAWFCFPADLPAADGPQLFSFWLTDEHGARLYVQCLLTHSPVAVAALDAGANERADCAALIVQSDRPILSEQAGPYLAEAHALLEAGDGRGFVRLAHGYYSVQMDPRRQEQLNYVYEHPSWQRMSSWSFEELLASLTHAGAHEGGGLQRRTCTQCTKSSARDERTRDGLRGDLARDAAAAALRAA